MNNFLRTKHYINGEWVGSNDTYSVFDPASGVEITKVAKGGKKEADNAINAARLAFETWSQKTAKERSFILRNWRDLMLENKQQLANLLSHEQGKPLAEALGEIAYAASFFEWFSQEAQRLYGDVIPSPKRDSRIVIIKQPVGVVAAITPWNFPLAMVTRKVGAALAAGCTIVLKPSEETPLSALALAVLAEKAGVPAGVFNIVSGDAPAIGGAFQSSPDVRKITFTGSTRTGKLLMKQASDTLKRISLELGGNAPFIVFEDADIEKAILGAMASKFRNTGQTCVCVNRFYIHDSVYDEFTTKLAAALQKLTVGPALEGNFDQGPLINQAALKKVEHHVKDALEKGAKVLCGGKPHALGKTFYEPTVLVEAKDNMLIASEETFGPIAACFRFHDEANLLKAVNNTPFGLAAYFYTNNYVRVWRFAEKIETGMIGINEGILSTEVAPFGGIKESGMGREGSKYGLDDYVSIKYLMMGGLSS